MVGEPSFCRGSPIIRTLAPFLAGVSRTPYGQFIGYNIAGGAIWVTLFSSRLLGEDPGRVT